MDDFLFSDLLEIAQDFQKSSSVTGSIQTDKKPRSELSGIQTQPSVHMQPDIHLKVQLNFALEEEGESSSNVKSVTESIIEPEDEIDILLEKRMKAQKLAETVLPKIEGQIQRCNDALSLCRSKFNSSSDGRAVLLRFKGTSEEALKEFDAKIARLDAEIADAQKEFIEACEALNKKTDEENKAKKKLKKWCWVPYYNIALLAKYEGTRKAYQNYVDTIGKRIDDIKRERELLFNEMIRTVKREEGLRYLLSLINDDSRSLWEDMIFINSMTSEWNQFYGYFLGLKSDVITCDDADEIDKEMNKAFAEIKKALEVEEAIGLKFALSGEFASGDNATPNDNATSIQSGTYRIQTYNSKFSVRPPVLVQAPVLGLNSHPESQLLLLTMIDGATIILDKNFKALTYLGNNELRFAPIYTEEAKVNSTALSSESGVAICRLVDDCKAVDAGSLKGIFGINDQTIVAFDGEMHGKGLQPSQKFYIEKYSGGDELYTICLYEDRKMCLDVKENGFQLWNVILLWERNGGVNQRFRIKKS